MALPKCIKQMITESDNLTVCPIRIAGIAAIIQYMTLGGLHYYQHHIFDAQNFAVGFGALFSGVGVALGLKKDSKPV
jgi:hypothetical protein